MELLYRCSGLALLLMLIFMLVDLSDQVDVEAPMESIRGRHFTVAVLDVIVHSIYSLLNDCLRIVDNVWH